MTTLSPELQQAARDFGAALRQHETVQGYLQAVSALAADPEAGALDERFASLHAALVARQRAGKNLPADEVQVYYALHAEVTGHPLIEERNHALTMAKGYLANVGLDFNRAVELDYVTIALS
jgi:cell fate (sporulation/competence/biofilm development) regulator YlbF (YheA/YmcA/DUF963 family)